MQFDATPIDLDHADLGPLRRAALDLADSLATFQELAFPAGMMLFPAAMAVRVEIGEAVQRMVAALLTLGCPPGRPFGRPFGGTAVRRAAVTQILAVLGKLGAEGDGFGTSAFFLVTTIPVDGNTTNAELAERLRVAVGYLEDAAVSDGKLPLSKTAAMILAVIPRGEKKGISAKGIVSAMKRKGASINESTLRKHILPKLKANHGVENHRSIGGYHRP